MYIQSLIQPSALTRPPNASATGNPLPQTGDQPSAYQTEALSSSIADDLISRTSEIMRDAEARGVDPDEQLRAVVSQALMDGWRRNREEAGMEGMQEGGQQEAEQDSKRSRTD